ncbi:SemiSWEET family sugar transporter [Mesoplasma florum]|uniref:SemiSWEET family sugar transporter n=1 Tax=Mesoplasma florum TaxID=2151 RepID=UPI000D034244|nr:SemiSWEET family transporter [Mesoplasma florum]AVN58924.1 hypothetical protein CG009_01625 [Mesoplasma florum]
MANVIGWMAFFTASFMMLPQVIKLVKHRKIEELSLFMYILATLNYLLWIVYGILLSSPQVYVANIFALTFSVLILICIIVNKIKSIKKGN